MSDEVGDYIAAKIHTEGSSDALMILTACFGQPDRDLVRELVEETMTSEARSISTVLALASMAAAVVEMAAAARQQTPSEFLNGIAMKTARLSAGLEQP